MGHIQNLEDLLIFLRRRWLLICILSLIGTVAAGVFAKTRPDTYEAFAAIEVQGQQLSSADASGSARLLQSIEQRLTTRENLLAVIARHGLYTDMPALSDEERATLLRLSISFEGIAAVGDGGYGSPPQLSAIIIKASDGSPDLAARIANDFAQGVLDMSSAGKLDQAHDTLNFYREEERRISTEIETVEAEVARYKNSHEIAGLATTQRDEIAAIEDDLRRLEQSLVAALEEQRPLAAKTTLRATEQRRMQELDNQIRVLNEQKAALIERREARASALAAQPEVERALAGYQRQLDQLGDSLSVVTARLTTAETEAKLIERQQGQRFALLDRATIPAHPVGSGGKKLVVAGAMASLLGAVALAFALDMLRPVLRTSAQMERELGLRPIVAIPELKQAQPRTRDMAARRALTKLSAVPVMVPLCCGLAAALFVAAALI
ncbi:Wzz/FepE/Etk N-terminal domain-containing protein [Xinfangfangia sp. CPCC 101601]|uniref:Wzz/FepE/Etk N-terminal domain-containing protein n=1 Tax=Pseudogemmobacter lacusdianii TaxID=3069608 RepID=A0ABU0VX93_9RHOB|nr:Wzz/FepE/Etk N-terminal domain-containing protein [Xinfangfangia sp. CPCC 101601]MDQ2066233.1 Wzz/FepE/Etk N-terminal domain-containing protein [Xinfangfangia sp. CPCC 101601]